MKTRIHVLKGKITFTSPLAERVFYERHEGKHALIELDDSPTNEMHAYYRGAILPYVFYQLPSSGWESLQDCHNALKGEFLGLTPFRSLSGEKSLVVASTGQISRVRMRKFLDDITAWMTEQAMEVPLPDEFKVWRDSAPGVGEEYPQLRHLKEAYARNKDNDKPWRKKRWG